MKDKPGVQIVTRIIELYQLQLEKYRSFLELAQNQFEGAKEGNTGAVRASLALKGKLLEEVDGLSEEIFNLKAKAILEAGLKDFTVSQLKEVFPEEAVRLSEVAGEIAGILLKSSEIEKQSQELLMKSGATSGKKRPTAAELKSVYKKEGGNDPGTSFFDKIK